MRNQGGRKKPTSRRIVPKSTFGIYIPADTPQEACDFLNVLKDNGTYSTDVIEILVQYLEVRKFLNPTDPLDGVTGNLLEQIQQWGVHRAKREVAPDEEERLFFEEKAVSLPEEPEPKQGGPGFDLNKTLQRMQRNKQLGAVNRFPK